MKSLHCIARARSALLGSTLAGALLLAPKEGKAAEDYSGWSLNFTPVLIAPKADYGWGGGADPELKYTIDRDGARLSAGLRIGAYYAKDSFGITASTLQKIERTEFRFTSLGSAVTFDF